MADGVLELLALVSGVTAVGMLLGRDYWEVWFPAPDAGASVAETAFSTRADSIGTVVEGSPDDSEHELWVRVGGELWKARAVGSVPEAGSKVEVLSTEGFVVRVREASGAPISHAPRPPSVFTRGRKVGLLLWAISVAACWIAVGSPLYALLGVPGAWLFAWVSLGSFGWD